MFRSGYKWWFNSRICDPLDVFSLHKTMNELSDSENFQSFIGDVVV